MKFSETWLKEWVNPKIKLDALSILMTNAGVEVESITPAAEAFNGVVVGQVTNIRAHPHADQLYICDVMVDNAASGTISIVSETAAVKKGMKVAVAKVNAVLPDNSVVVAVDMKGVISNGLLLSPKELGLSEDNDSILELPLDASVGEDLWKYFKLEDNILDVSITPNRGDCLSIQGIAREVSALTHAPLQEIPIHEIKPDNNEKLAVTISAESDCPHYVGRIIHNVKADAITPLFITERLRRSCIRSISPIVDVANYVMLELGQPMHAFDLNKLNSEIIVRHAKDNERIALLDGSEKILNSETLVIADKNKPHAIAGVMGGMDSSVTLLTKSIFLESAYFAPETVARSRQYYRLTSDSAYRFERGVDPELQKKAIERATQLILNICQGEAGPIIDVKTNNFPKRKKIVVEKEKIKKILGITISENEIENILVALQFKYQKTHTHAWEIEPPSFRFDINITLDVIEEIGRVYGYNRIPIRDVRAHLNLPAKEKATDYRIIRTLLSNLGYHEIITYSFINRKLQQLIDPNEDAFELINPISDEMSVMRTSLWPGLISNMLYNADRQQYRIQLFETGRIFLKRNEKVEEKFCIAGLITLIKYKEQWGIRPENFDFYDLKGHVETVFKVLNKKVEFRKHEPDNLREWAGSSQTALHPGQSAAIYIEGKRVGLLGALHPNILQALDFKEKVFLFDLNLDLIGDKGKIMYSPFSKFPEIRRDLAIIVNETVPAKNIQDTIESVAGSWLKDNFIFDVYQGKGISSGCKSIALALILQHPTRTLIDAEVNELMEHVVLALKEQFGAELRS